MESVIDTLGMAGEIYTPKEKDGEEGEASTYGRIYIPLYKADAWHRPKGSDKKLPYKDTNGKDMAGSWEKVRDFLGVGRFPESKQKILASMSLLVLIEKVEAGEVAIVDKSRYNVTPKGKK